MEKNDWINVFLSLIGGCLIAGGIAYGIFRFVVHRRAPKWCAERIVKKYLRRNIYVFLYEWEEGSPDDEMPIYTITAKVQRREGLKSFYLYAEHLDAEIEELVKLGRTPRMAISFHRFLGEWGVVLMGSIKIEGIVDNPGEFAVYFYPNIGLLSVAGSSKQKEFTI